MPDIASIGFVPFIVTWFAALTVVTAIKSKRWGADNNKRAARIGRAGLYIVAIQLLLLAVPIMGWYAAPLAIVLIVLFAAVNFWIMHPGMLDSRPDTSKLGKLDLLTWSDDKLTWKRWFVKGDAMPLIWWVRRTLFVTFGLYMALVAILIGLFGGVEDEAKSRDSRSTATVAEQTTEPTAKPTDNTDKKSSASPTPSPSVVSSSPAPKPSKTAAAKDDNCNAPELTPADNTKKSPFSASRVKTCRDGEWVAWKTVYPKTGSTFSALFTAYAEDTGYGYGTVTWDNQEVLIRFPSAVAGYDN